MIIAPYIKYPDSESPILGRYLYPAGHPHYGLSVEESIKRCVNRGLLYQGRLWDAYSGCNRDVFVSRRRND